MNYWLLSIPLLSAFAGWVTIRIAIWLLFHPLRPKRLLGFQIQGAWPGHREKIAKAAGTYAVSVFDPAELQQQISQPSRFDEIKPLIEEHIDHFLKHKLQQQMPMIAMFIGDKTIAQLKTIFIQEIELLFPEVIGKMAGNMGQQDHLAQLIAKKIEAIPPEKIEAAFSTQFAPAVKKAGLLGLIIGLLIGLIQLLIVLQL